jgi:hypothetical protein
VFSAGLVYVGTTIVGLNLRSFAAANILLIVLWLAVAVLLLRERRALSARAAAEEAA